MMLALAIFGITYVLIITEWINKMIAAMVGGFIIIWFGIVDQHTALSSIDWNVIFFLIGMMMVISVLKETGLFMYIAIRTAKIAKGIPIRIMVYMFFATVVLSAVLGSVTTVMILVPIVLLICGELKISPVPFVISMAIASNIGGAATMIGDPPNILIGSATSYSFLDFIINLTPPVIVISATSMGLLHFIYRKKMVASNELRARLMNYSEKNLIKRRKLMYFGLYVLGVMLIAFCLQSVFHIETATISMSAGLLLVIASGTKKVEHLLAHEIDWVTIFFFVGLFMLVESLVETGFINVIANSVMSVTKGEPRLTSIVILWLSGVFSAVIDNVPFVAAMIPVLEHLGILIDNPSQMHPIWWALALGTCLGGNGTLIGASANIVAVGIANRNGFHISFKEFTKIGTIFTLNAIIISTIYILFRYY